MIRRLTKLLIILLLIVGFLLFTGCSSSIPTIQIKDNESIENKLTSIDHWLKELSEKRQFNGAILFSIDGKVKLMNTYGFSDHSRTKPLTNQSSFRLGSVSKQFTAMAIMILKEHGKLKFDDSVQKYLKDFPYNDVTIRHLLTHTSGIPDHDYLVIKSKKKIFPTMYFFTTGQSWENNTSIGKPSKFKDTHEILSMEDVLDLVIKYSHKRKFNAGEKFLYCDTGYVLLAYLVEQISGITFESYLDQKIFNPLKMDNSSVWNLNTAPEKLIDRVQGTNKSRLNDYTWLDGFSGDGCIFVSIEDFIKWDRSLANNKLVTDSTFNEAISPFITTEGDTTYYGFGWGLSKNGKSIWHDGSWAGATTYIKRHLDTDILFILLDSSTNSKNVLNIKDTINDILGDSLK